MGFLEQHTVDFVIWRADQELQQAGSDPSRKSEALVQVARLLAVIPDQVKQSYYVDLLKKKFAVNKRQFVDAIRRQTPDDETSDSEDKLSVKLPQGVDSEQAYQLGFYEHKNCYYFLTAQGGLLGSNFVIRPLFHIYSKTDNKRLIEITNVFGRRRVVDVPTKMFVSVEQFQSLIAGEGNYLFYGNKQQFFKVLSKVMEQMPICEELKILGWQREGFLAFSNGIFNGSYQGVDEMGMVTHKDKLYFSPAYSKMYVDTREDDDEYEADRYFIHKNSPINLSQWADLMMKVYSQNNNAMIAIAFFIASCFRDFIYSRFKIFPHLFLFGEKQSGKSQMGWSLSNVFFDNMPPFNLNSGTFVGFSRKLARYRNTISWFDEYTNDVDEKRFQQLKAAYDGVGHEKGKMSRDNRTEITPVNASCVISGQYLPTRDDNALFTRSILLQFQRQNFTREQVEAYTSLKNYEMQGLSGILCEVVSHRELIEKQYVREFDMVFNELKNHIAKTGQEIEERLVRNFATILTPLKIIPPTSICLPFTYQELLQQTSTLLQPLSALLTTTESLAVFWDMVIYLYNKGLIRENYDFKIEVLLPGAELTVSQGYGKGKYNKEKLVFDAPRELLFINLTQIHPLYLEYHRKQFGSNGLDKASLTHYIKSAKGYLGLSASTRYEHSNTSSYIFDQEVMRDAGVNLKHTFISNDTEVSENKASDPDPFTSNVIPF